MYWRCGRNFKIANDTAPQFSSSRVRTLGRLGSNGLKGAEQAMGEHHSNSSPHIQTCNRDK